MLQGGLRRGKLRQEKREVFHVEHANVGSALRYVLSIGNNFSPNLVDPWKRSLASLRPTYARADFTSVREKPWPLNNSDSAFDFASA